MKKLADLCIIVAIVAIVIGVISRLAMQPIMGVFAQAFINFASTLLLLAIALLLKEK